jgi:hypothetical protein
MKRERYPARVRGGLFRGDALKCPGSTLQIAAYPEGIKKSIAVRDCAMDS